MNKENITTVQNDLSEIKDICNTLIGIFEKVFNTKHLDNRAYNVLLILKHSFEDELKQVEQGEIIPF